VQALAAEARAGVEPQQALVEDLKKRAAALGRKGILEDDESGMGAWALVGPGGVVPAKLDGPSQGQQRSLPDSSIGPALSEPCQSEAAQGLVEHDGWRPQSGYKPVDTSGVDAMRPQHQQEAIAALARRDQARARRVERAVAARAANAAADSCRTGGGKFSFTEHLRYQAAIKAFLRADKRKRACSAAT
jgi:hypothetical protein